MQKINSKINRNTMVVVALIMAVIAIAAFTSPSAAGVNSAGLTDTQIAQNSTSRISSTSPVLFDTSAATSTTATQASIESIVSTPLSSSVIIMGACGFILLFLVAGSIVFCDSYKENEIRPAKKRLA